MKNLKSRLAVVAALAICAWAAVALASGPFGPGPWYQSSPSDAGGCGYAPSGEFTNGVETVSNASYVQMMAVPIYPGSAIAGHSMLACTAITAPSGGDAGDYAAASFDWAAKMNADAGVPVVAGTTSLSAFSSASMSGVGATATAIAGPSSATGAIALSVSTVSVGTIDCEMRTTWVQVN